MGNLRKGCSNPNPGFFQFQLRQNTSASMENRSLLAHAAEYRLLLKTIGEPHEERVPAEALEVGHVERQAHLAIVCQNAIEETARGKRQGRLGLRPARVSFGRKCTGHVGRGWLGSMRLANSLAFQRVGRRRDRSGLCRRRLKIRGHRVHRRWGPGLRTGSSKICRSPIRGRTSVRSRMGRRRVSRTVGGSPSRVRWRCACGVRHRVERRDRLWRLGECCRRAHSGWSCLGRRRRRRHRVGGRPGQVGMRGVHGRRGIRHVPQRCSRLRYGDRNRHRHWHWRSNGKRRSHRDRSGPSRLLRRYLDGRGASGSSTLSSRQDVSRRGAAIVRSSTVIRCRRRMCR